MIIRKSTIEKLKAADHKELLGIIESFEKLEGPLHKIEENYYDGQNTSILNRKISDDKNVPNNKIPVSYGKKIIKTVAGYMYKPGNVVTTLNDESQDEILKDIYKWNNEETKTSICGSFQGVNGLSFELHYYEYDAVTNELYPRFTFVKASEGIPIYNYDIEPQLICFIRHYMRNDECYYEVYYDDVIQYYKSDKRTGELVSTAEDKKNEYNQVPVVVYKNNEFQSSDISIIKPLIDAYDVLMSDSMNEFDRFSFAYLLLVEMDVSPDDAKEIKSKRMFTNLPSPDAVKFLTKDIPTPFITFMSDLMRKEIHKQSFIPDVDEISFSGGTSGVTIDKWVYMMEYTAADKEAYMKQGLTKRLELFEALGVISLDGGYEFTFKRNLPSSDRANAEIYNMLYGKGVMTETLMKQYLTFIKDVTAEMEGAKEEKSAGVDTDLMSSVIDAVNRGMPMQQPGVKKVADGQQNNDKKPLIEDGGSVK